MGEAMGDADRDAPTAEAIRSLERRYAGGLRVLAEARRAAEDASGSAAAEIIEAIDTYAAGLDSPDRAAWDRLLAEVAAAPPRWAARLTAEDYRAVGDKIDRVLPPGGAVEY